MISTNDIQNQSITLDKLSPEVIDTLYNTVPIGTVIFSMRTDIPNGFLKADGTEYSRLQYPQFYDMLVANSLPTLTYANWTTEYTTNSGNVGKFGLDTTNKKFKMICLTDSFIRSTITTNNIGTYQTDAIQQGLSGSFEIPQLGNDINGTPMVSGAFSWFLSPNFQVYSSGAFGNHNPAIRFDAANVVRTGSDTRPKNIQMNAYVCVYNSADDVSHMSLSAFAYTDLSNITTLPISGTGTSSLTGADLKPGKLFTGPDVVISSWRANDGTAWYRRYKSGWLEQGGIIASPITETTATVTFPVAFTTTNIYVQLTVTNPDNGTGGSRDYWIQIGNPAPTTTTFKIMLQNSNQNTGAGNTYWEARGY